MFQQKFFIAMSSIILIIGLIFAGSSLTAHAQTTYSFTKNLVWGMKANPDVAVLQQFLANQGVYSGPVTGNFLGQTYKALVAFQMKEGIRPASGYFGPLSRTDANTVMAMNVQPATVTTTAAPELSNDFALSLA